MNFGFYHTPEKLYNSAVRITNLVKGFIGLAHSSEIFYTTKDGNWGDTSIWETVSGRSGKLPTASDDVYIKHTVYTSVPSVSVNNMFISNVGILKYDDIGPFRRDVVVFGKLSCLGTIDARSSTGYGMWLKLYNKTNILVNYLTSNFTSAGNFEYAGGDQEIMALPYRNLALSGTGTKYLTGNTTVERETWLMTGTCKLELLGFDFNSGSSQLLMQGSLSKIYTSGKVIIPGGLVLKNGSVNTLDFSAGNPDVEIQSNGIVHENGFNGNVRFLSGTGTWKFTNVNQSILDNNANGVLNFMGNIYIDNGLTLTVGGGAGTYITLQLYGQTIAGNSASKIIMKDRIFFMNSTAASNFMTGALFDFSTYSWNNNYIGYLFNGNFTIPYTSLGGLWITGTGIKTLSGTTTLLGNLNMPVNGSSGSPTTLDCSTYNLSISLTTNISPYNVLYKNSSGNILFTGLLSLGYPDTLNFASSVEVECRGGWYCFCNSTNWTVNGNWTYTTNNQTIYCNYAYNEGMLFTGNWSIIGAITITNNDSFQNNIKLSGTFTGSVAGSTFINKSTGSWGFNINSTNTMLATGVFDCTTYANRITHTSNANSTLQFQNYWHLRLQGTGIRTLKTGNNTFYGDLYIDSGAYLDKPDATNLLCKGLFSIYTLAGFTCHASANIELQNGLYTYWNSYTYWVVNTGNWSFTTNNQILKNDYGFVDFQVPLLISGAITLTTSIQTHPVVGTKFTAGVNGNNANSIFSVQGTIFWEAATVPMTTGKFYANQFTTGVFNYSKAGNQDIRVPDDPVNPGYRNLTLSGSGAKKLLGNVSVKGTYSLVAPATLDSNGFTLTNP